MQNRQPRTRRRSVLKPVGAPAWRDAHGQSARITRAQPSGQRERLARAGRGRPRVVGSRTARRAASSGTWRAPDQHVGCDERSLAKAVQREHSARASQHGCRARSLSGRGPDRSRRPGADEIFGDFRRPPGLGTTSKPMATTRSSAATPAIDPGGGGNDVIKALTVRCDPRHAATKPDGLVGHDPSPATRHDTSPAPARRRQRLLSGARARRERDRRLQQPLDGIATRGQSCRSGLTARNRHGRK